MAYVVKGTPPGYDVTSAIDYLLSFNSSWPLLKLHETNTSASTISHNVNYPPFHIIASTFVEGGVDQDAHTEWSVSSTQLVRSSGSDSRRYFIFRLDLTINFTAPIEPGSTTQTTQNDGYVFKVTKPGKATNSADMRDFALHSNTRSPMVHMVNHGAMSNTGGGLGLERTVTHNLGYVPTAFVFIRPSTNSLGLDANRYGIVMPPVGVSGRFFTVSSSNVYVTADSTLFTSTPDVSIVILKDPFAKPTVNVSFP